MNQGRASGPGFESGGAPLVLHDNKSSRSVFTWVAILSAQAAGCRAGHVAASSTLSARCSFSKFRIEIIRLARSTTRCAGDHGIGCRGPWLPNLTIDTKNTCTRTSRASRVGNAAIGRSTVATRAAIASIFTITAAATVASQATRSSPLSTEMATKSAMGNHLMPRGEMNDIAIVAIGTICSWTARNLGFIVSCRGRTRTACSSDSTCANVQRKYLSWQDTERELRNQPPTATGSSATSSTACIFWTGRGCSTAATTATSASTTTANQRQEDNRDICWNCPIDRCSRDLEEQSGQGCISPWWTSCSWWTALSWRTFTRLTLVALGPRRLANQGKTRGKYKQDPRSLHHGLDLVDFSLNNIDIQHVNTYDITFTKGRASGPRGSKGAEPL